MASEDIQQPGETIDELIGGLYTPQEVLELLGIAERLDVEQVVVVIGSRSEASGVAEQLADAVGDESNFTFAMCREVADLRYAITGVSSEGESENVSPATGVVALPMMRDYDYSGGFDTGTPIERVRDLCREVDASLVEIGF